MELFNVTQFFTDEEAGYETVRSNVNAKEAMEAFKHYTNNVAVKMGFVSRVIITDSGDCINAEWKKDEGYTYPPELVAATRK